MTQTIKKGSTHRMLLRWEQSSIQYVAVTGITKAAPAVVTAPSHGMPDGWRFALSGVAGGASVLNAENDPPTDDDYFKGKVLSANTIEINSVNGAAWASAGTGGILQYNKPVDFTGATARAQVRETDSSAAPALITLDSDDGSIEIDDNGLVTLIFTPEMTRDLNVDSAVFDVEITLADNSIMSYPVTEINFQREVTR